MHDRHYTPAEVAKRMVDAAIEIGLPKSGRALDLTAGEGVLLEAVAKQLDWEMIACDLDAAAVASLRRRYPAWTVGKCDIYSAASRASSKAMRVARNVDLAVLNPPYSYRGGRSRSVPVDSDRLSGSPASCAFALAAQLVGPSGVVVGLLPVNARQSERDQPLWSWIEAAGRIEGIEVLHRGTFSGEFATTEIVRWQKGPKTLEFSGTRVATRSSPTGCRCLELVRGTVPVHNLGRADRQGSTSYLHTTNLKSGTIRLDERRAAAYLATPGPFLLLPRVGLVAEDKLAIRRSAAVLSDCLFALRPLDTAQLHALRALLTTDHLELRQLYTGTCARYLTVKRLTQFLRERGWHVTNPGVRASPSRTCECGSSGV